MKPTGDTSAAGTTGAAEAILARARRVLILTGAGISAESGVPTFRGDAGLWKSFRPEDLATPEAFARDPRLVWEWYGWRRELIASCKPNEAHLAIAAFAHRRSGVTVVTQNVDGLHVVAARMVTGSSDPGPSLPLELHGAIHRLRCTWCGWRSEDRRRVDASTMETLPRCEQCGALARPDVVWFGEPLDEQLLARAFEEASRADACLVVGTSGLVHPAASIPLAVVRHGGALIEVNPDETALSDHAAVRIPARAVAGVPPLLTA